MSYDTCAVIEIKTGGRWRPLREFRHPENAERARMEMLTLGAPSHLLRLATYIDSGGHKEDDTTEGS